MPKIVDKDEMRTKIMDAAVAVYTRIGYHAATIDAVAKEAGLGKGTLYLYFKGKEDLTVCLADRIFEGMEQKFMGEPHCDTLEAFSDKLKRTMDIEKDHAGFIRVFFEVFGPSFASDAFVKSVSGFFDRLGEFYAEQIKQLQATGEASTSVDADTLGRSLAAMADGIILHRGLFDLPVKRHRMMIDQSVTLVKAGLAR